MKRAKITFIFLIIFIFNFTAYAMPSRQQIIKFRQPTGETFDAKIMGDEKISWVETTDGEVVSQGEDGYWYYSQLINGELIKSSSKYLIDKKPDKYLTGKKFLSSEYIKKYSRIQKHTQLKSVTQNNRQPILLVLVEYSDISLNYGLKEWSNLIFNFQYDSLNSYYNEVSQGKLTFEPANELFEENDGIVKVKLNKTHPRPERLSLTQSQKDEIYQNMVKDIINNVNNYVDFSSFDKNKDKVISTDELHVILVIAGYERSYSYTSLPSVWGHKWGLYNGITLDGVRLLDENFGGSYIMIGERHSDHMATVGIIAHEIGHNLGLPDLYDVDGSSLGVGIHSLMGLGSWAYDTGYPGSKPAHLDAWSKVKLGFVEPLIFDSIGYVTLNSILSGSYNIVKILTKNVGEYFLIENRQFEGFDIGLSGYLNNGGIAIWHIDENVIENNPYEVNSNEYHKGVDIEEANEGKLGYSQLDRNKTNEVYDHYYYVGNNTTFDMTTRPNSNLYDGTSSHLRINVLDNSSSSMRVKIELLDKYGDLDRDGKITNSDLQMLKNMFLNNSPQLENLIADVNGDEKVTISDYVIIKQYVLNKINSFPVNNK